MGGLRQVSLVVEGAQGVELLQRLQGYSISISVSIIISISISIIISSSSSSSSIMMMIAGAQRLPDHSRYVCLYHSCVVCWFMCVMCLLCLTLLFIVIVRCCFLCYVCFDTTSCVQQIIHSYITNMIVIVVCVCVVYLCLPGRRP